jgi:hypothetical protein
MVGHTGNCVASVTARAVSRPSATPITPAKPILEKRTCLPLLCLLTAGVNFLGAFLRPRKSTYIPLFVKNVR